MAKEDEKTPSILYHYTSIEAFRKILESGKMRATRYDQMNDTGELQLGIDNLLKAVKNHEIDGSSREHEWKDFLISAIEGYKDGSMEVYVLSLSGDSDSLGQWIAYTPNGGVAVGFDSEKVRKGFLCDVTAMPDLNNRLMRCLYTDKHGQVDLRARVADHFFKPDSYCAFFARREAIAQHVLQATLSVAIYRTICSIKHGAYASENEWRSVNYRPDQGRYPVKLDEKYRFHIEMKFDPMEFVREIWISPHGDKRAYERVAAHLKEEYGLQFTIEKSKIPFQRP